MNQISECCDAPLVYHIWKKSDGSIGYEPWEFCPQCLECCSGYNLLTQNATNDTIKRALKRLRKQYGFGEKNETKISKEQREKVTELC